MTANAHRRAHRVTADALQPGTWVAPWGDASASHRLVRWCFTLADDCVLVQWGDHTVTRHHRWAVFHRRG